METKSASTIVLSSPPPEHFFPRSTPAPCPAQDLKWWLVLLLVWAVSGLYTAHLLKRGWVPYDEGTLGQSAERALQGQLPHRDFDDPYTGGLTYLNALAFSTLGTNSASPRIVMFIFFMAFVPAVYAIASRFTSPVGAGGATLLSVAWSMPNYSAALPSWYNLFFAVFGAAAGLRYLETNRRWWIFLAGLCGGVSCLFKIVGLYFVGAIFLTLVFRELFVCYEESGKPGASRAYPIFLKAFFVVLASGLFVMVKRMLNGAVLVEFVLPGAALAGLCLRRDSLRPRAVASSERFHALFRMVLPFAAGVFLPIAIFSIPYIRSGSVRDLLAGVFWLPIRRLDFAVLQPAGFGLRRIIATVILCGLLALAMYLRTPLNWPRRLLLVATLGFMLLAAARFPHVYRFALGPITVLIPFAVFAVVLLLGWERASCAIPDLRQQQIVLLAGVAAFCSLVQVPFAAVIYFCYAAPLLILALLGLYSVGERKNGFLLGALTIFYIAFAVLWFTPSFIAYMGYQYVPDRQIHRLTFARAGGLRVYPVRGEIYDQLIHTVQEHANGSEYVYCGPDCPEISFFSGMRNPTRILFDFFEDAAARNQRVLSAVESRPMNVIVICLVPAFSKPMNPELQGALRERFPQSTRIGDFEVRWRK